MTTHLSKALADTAHLGRRLVASRQFSSARAIVANRRAGVAKPTSSPSSSRSFHAVSAAAGGSSPWNSKTGCTKSSSASQLNSKGPSSSLTVRAFSSGGKRDFYEVLGVDRGADKGTIKKAYFKLAKQYHPDTNQGDKTAADKFKEATEAYEVLSDDKQREMYNNFGHAGVDPNFQGAEGGNPFEGFEGFNFQDGSFHFSQGGGGQEMDAEEIFDMFFGAGGGNRRRRNRGPRRGADLQMHVRLTFQEAVFGTEKELNLRYQHVDRKTGNVEIKDRDVNVTIPAGIDNGMNLRLQGQGAEGDPGAPAGNLLVQVIVDGDPYFQRNGYDIHTEKPLSFTQAILGGTVDVRTLHGEVELKIPQGCQPDSKLLLRGKGIKELNGSRKGDHYVHVKIEIPKKISARQEELLREFDEETKNPGGFAKAASSAFEKLFGKKGGKNGKAGGKKEEVKDDQPQSEGESEADEKKTA